MKQNITSYRDALLANPSGEHGFLETALLDDEFQPQMQEKADDIQKTEETKAEDVIEVSNKNLLDQLVNFENSDVTDDSMDIKETSYQQDEMENEYFDSYSSRESGIFDHLFEFDTFEVPVFSLPQTSLSFQSQANDVEHSFVREEIYIANDDMLFLENPDVLMETLLSISVINGGGGNDTLNGLSENDTIFGRAGDDIIFGGAGDDTIFGGADNDTITGGTGADSLQGGAGADIFVFDSDAFDGSIDEILDFNPTEGDVLDFQSTITAFLSGGNVAGGIGSILNLVDDGTDTRVEVDVDGIWSGSSFVHVANLIGVTGLDAQALFDDGNFTINTLTVNAV